MGVFEAAIGIGQQAGGPLTSVSALVDTGAAHSMMPQSLLASLDLEPSEAIVYALADGSRVEYGYGMARFAIGGREWPCPVIFGQEGEYLLGATTLEVFNFKVDPVEQRLLPTDNRARSI